jgi:oxygen-independent coproporphyrinogen-3 oxidase
MPWCVRKCPYCDFNSHAQQGELPQEAYIDALVTELQSRLTVINQRPIHSIFIGGGTPSLFSPQSYATLFNAIARLCTLEKNIEITLEANPGTVEQTNFQGYRDVGINRLSLGIQSFQTEKLKSLGRIHGSEEAHRAVAIAHQTGFTNINIDLMHGLPKQTIDDALYDLKTALTLAPTHLSWYQLTLEPNTYFYKHPPRLPKDEAIWKMQLAGKQLLAENNFNQYEVSAFCQPSFHCQHNLNYWEFGDYLGIGAGAHSKITHYNGHISRHSNVKSPKNYLDKDKTRKEEEKILTADELVFEFMLNALRLQKPIPHDLFTARTGLPLTYIQHSLQLAHQYQFLEPTNNCFTLTPLGTHFLNDVIELFLIS